MPRCQAKIILSLLLALPVTGFTEIQSRHHTEKTAELEGVRTRIEGVKTRIKDAHDKTQKLQRELRENKIKTTKTLAFINDTKRVIEKKQARVEKLTSEQAISEQRLELGKQQLAQQIRSAYQIGRNNYIKLLLNQDAPGLVGRALAYYDYHNKVHAERIENVKLTLANLASVRSSIRSETEKLESLNIQHENKLTVFSQYRKTRRDIITRLQGYLDEQGIVLQTLQANERKLEKLFQGLGRDQATEHTALEEMRPFNTLQGKLRWPIQGKFLQRFGNQKKSGNLQWQGVLINAERGAHVNAISAGKVVFADWFQNLGLLIIIDHGDGYMSLYGHNQSLLKNTGDQVITGEMIANVGDSGGLGNAALYFEIRKGVEPLNPEVWCKRVAAE